MSEYIIGQELDNYVYLLIPEAEETDINNVISVIKQKYIINTYKYIPEEEVSLYIKLKVENDTKFIDFIRDINNLNYESIDGFKSITTFFASFSKDKRYLYFGQFSGNINTSAENILEIEETTILNDNDKEFTITKYDDGGFLNYLESKLK